jgi:16S rRNA (uracil1498-N3)-methyltransferase
MPIHDFTSQRLYVPDGLTAGASLAVTDDQFNYLIRVLRLGAGDAILVFNGRDGEWRAQIAAVAKRGCRLEITACVRAQTVGPDIDYLFAPLKRARLDYMVQKAVELGVRRLRPVLTRHTIAERVNGERMLANAIEAAEQCGILHIPQVDAPVKLDVALADWEPGRLLIFCDEAATVTDPVAALAPLRGKPVAVLIGPEGGFDAAERRLLQARSFTRAISLGPRIMRADTAAVAALALVNATIGDWR